MKFYRAIFATGLKGDDYLLPVLNACEYYEDHYEEARKDALVPNGIPLLSLQSRIAGMWEQRWAQFQELEAIVQYLEERENVIKTEKMKGYLEHYQRTLSDRTAKDYADAADEVQNLRFIRHRVGLIKNLYSGICTALNTLQFQITNQTKLKAAGLDDAVIDTRY